MVRLKIMAEFTLKFKTPDVLEMLPDECFETDDCGFKFVKEDVNKVLSLFLEYDEYIEIKFNTDSQTAKVQEVS